MSFLFRLKSFTLTSPLQNNQKKKNITGDTRKEEWILHNIMNIKTVHPFNNWTNHKTTFKSNLRYRRMLHNLPVTNGSIFIPRRRISTVRLKKNKNVSIVRRRQQLVLAMFFQRRWKATFYVFRNTCGALWSAKETSKTSSCRATRWAIFLSWSLCY